MGLSGQRKPDTPFRSISALLTDIAVWMSFFTLAQGWRLWHRLCGHRAPRIAFSPDQPRPWYFIWPVLHAAGAIIEKDSEKADVIFHFDDATLLRSKTASCIAKGQVHKFQLQ